MKHSLIFVSLLFLVPAAAQSQRPLKSSDVYRLKSVADPRISPDGNWIAHVVSVVDSAKDKRISDLWMSSWDGKSHVQLTYTPDGESMPRFSPDGKYLSFMSSRTGLSHGQIWVMDRRGGEARKLTNIKGEISDYAWSPDGKQIALVIQDLERPDSLKDKTKLPYVIDQVHFKRDVEGYIRPLKSHLYLFDVSTSKLDTLTRGKYDETRPVWSPDGTQIAFVSNRTAEPDRNDNTDIYIIEAKVRGTMRQLTTWGGSDDTPRWSPDGTRIAYLQSTAADNFLMYDQPILTVIQAAGGSPRQLTRLLDRPVSSPEWAPDGKHIALIVSDDRKDYLAEIEITSGDLRTVNEGERSFMTLSQHPAGHWLTMVSEPHLPAEIFAVESGNLRQITHHHDDFLKPLALGSVKGFTSRSKDGTLVSNLLFLPPGVTEPRKLPTIFFIHGGPVAQDEYGFDLSRQMLAASGYAVVAVNYRGSSGRGLAFCKAIYSDWGNKEVMDIIGASDYVVQQGIADPAALGIGGWSYGGILTNYSIATDPQRFKAAASGAGSSLQLSMFGVDQYITQFENEIGYPWKNLDKYLKLSYPFLKADRIKTPTLFMVGEKDFNVPAVGSEQMYQALRVQGVPTNLIIYPNQFHGITVPGYQKDRFDRYIKWFDQYLRNTPTATVNKEIHK
ncbi:MAG: S9 family peptidase [Cyclobacteriaceae bacterium]|nr:S9 family peptidase [Cyclobacteriaceae bacterium]